MNQEISIQNTLTGQKEIFRPLEEGKVKMYVCGITPYDECHLGHARCYVFFDTVRRFFKSVGYQVTYIQNFTDIDDKIIARANSLNQKTEEVSNRYIEDYFTQMGRLNILQADAYPRVTQVLPQIMSFIGKLIEKGYAYTVEDDVMFSVSKFQGYGKLSKRSMDEMEAGARVEVDLRKRDPLDFALWKKAKEGEPMWNAPWGPGRPGWHIECSAMSYEHLGETFDIHGGGQDLIFPHHENEIAQSEGANGKPFARYWIHNGFVTVNREKMSKSLGNFFTLREIFEKYDPETVRLFLLSRHYRTPLDFSDDLLEQSKSGLESLNDTYDMAQFVYWKERGTLPKSNQLVSETLNEFNAALCDDFNTEKALSVIFNLRNQIAQKLKLHGLTSMESPLAGRGAPVPEAGNPLSIHGLTSMDFRGAGLKDRKVSVEWLESATATLRQLCEEALGLKLKTPLHGQPFDGELQSCLNSREEARKSKRWSESDEWRSKIKTMGYIVEDTPWGQRVKKVS